MICVIVGSKSNVCHSFLTPGTIPDFPIKREKMICINAFTMFEPLKFLPFYTSFQAHWIKDILSTPLQVKELPGLFWRKAWGLSSGLSSRLGLILDHRHFSWDLLQTWLSQSYTSNFYIGFRSDFGHFVWSVVTTNFGGWISFNGSWLAPRTWH